MTRTAPASGGRAQTRPSQLADFRARCELLAGRPLSDPSDLHAFSVDRPDDFWRSFLLWADLAWSGSPDTVLVGHEVETARFFPDVRLNYTENLLRPLPGRDDDAPALTSVHADAPPQHYTRRELRQAVLATAGLLRAQGVEPGSRVVAIAPNNARTTIAVLAAAALGATVSTATPDMGVAALAGRFDQVDPHLLILDRTSLPQDGADSTDELLAQLSTVRRLLVLDDLPLPTGATVPVERLAAPETGGATALEEWPRFAFDHPLFVMFSSGTTGPPKAIVHGAGGTLIEHVKEHRLHGDLTSRDTMYFHTTTAWMMWNWQLSALAVGAHIVLNDGPVLGPSTLWELVAEHRVTVFGTSPAYLQLCEDAGYRPADVLPPATLRAIMSTGAVLHAWQFDWVAEAVGPQPVQSISGGTDIIGCFLLGHPELPVRPGRCQTRSLGLDVAALDESGREVVGAVGELVCRRPFPSRPVGFLRDPDGSRFHASYFADHGGVWTHGDLVEIGDDGSARLHGRSDGVLNVNGIRIGPSEIYTALRPLNELADVMAVEQRDPTEHGHTRMVLLVVLAEGAALDGELERRIRTTLRRNASAAHVPSLIVAVADLPHTHNGKRSERAARDAANGDPVRNADALRNPSCLTAITAAVRLRERQPAAGADDETTRDTLNRIWSSLLGVQDIRPDDNFFDLGGTSRQSMSLLRSIDAELGRRIPGELFLTNPTLAALTEVLESGAELKRADVQSLVAGNPDRTPLLLMHDAWGDVDGYRSLTDQLGTELPVIGIQAELEDETGRALTFDEVVAADLARVLEFRPEGPYRLAGYSFGGLVAFEVARALESMGRTVEFLGLFDVRPPLAALSPMQRRLRRTAERAAFLVPGMSENTVREFVRDRLRPTEQPLERTILFRSARIYDAHVFAPYAGPVTYFRAQWRIPVASNLMSAWRRVAPRLRVIDVPGAHHDMLGRTNAPSLAAALTASLPD